MKWYVYIVECSDGTYYTGITTNLLNRIKAHNNGKGAKYTKHRSPVILRYSKEFQNRSDASKEEYRIKQLNRIEKMELIKNY